MEAFAPEANSKLKWYVYRLIDPRSGNTFYVGKGQGNRVFEHARGALKENDIDETDRLNLNLKRDTIKDINRDGLDVQYLIHRHGLETSELAYEVEAALIDAYPGLSNLAGGHGSSIYGCRTVKQINSAYAAEPLVAKEPLILIFIGKSRESERDIYNAVRGVWKMSIIKAGRYKLVLAYDGVIVNGAYRPKKWLDATKVNFPFLTKDQPGRIGFEGDEADVSALYVGKRVPPREPGAANPFRYLSAEAN